jgi:hypothetical protein
MNVTVVGAFDNFAQAEEARRALVNAGVPEGHIVVDVGESGACMLGVQAQSSLERVRIVELLRRGGALRTEQRTA